MIWYLCNFQMLEFVYMHDLTFWIIVTSATAWRVLLITPESKYELNRTKQSNWRASNPFSSNSIKIWFTKTRNKVSSNNRVADVQKKAFELCCSSFGLWQEEALQIQMLSGLHLPAKITKTLRPHVACLQYIFFQIWWKKISCSKSLNCHKGLTMQTCSLSHNVK